MEMMDDHSHWPMELWERVKGDVDEFNRHIVGNIGRKNVCANTICSFALKYTYDTLYSVLQMLGKRQGDISLCDYGCCNANISFSMLLGGHVSTLRAYDLYSESTEYIKHRIRKYGLEERAEWRDVDAPATGELFDVVYCIDVLEHTKNPSQILETQIAPLIKKLGYLIIQAPWGGGVVSHLDEAIVDFYSQGGRKFLLKNFIKIYSMTPLDISGVWQKIS
jgi:2-polyprenyl-3-methyl-5-hydroxy-6-metoxy-1,4-benzoquinol methylase